MSYQLPMSGPGVLRISDGKRIVEADAPAWFEYQQWLSEPNTPSPPPPVQPPPIVVSYEQWLALFTSAEREWAFSSTNPHVVEAITRGASARTISLSSPTVAAFLDLCISLGSPLTEERKNQVISGTPPA